jgi:peptide/nickel transport system permease protein
MIFRRFIHHRLAVGSLVVLGLVMLLALFGGRVWHYSYAFQSHDLSQGPTLRHPFGTDELGRDTFAQVLRGANKSVIIALVVASLSTAFGTLVGAIAGFYRRWVDTVLMRVTDLALTIPTYAAAAALAYQFSGGNNGWVYLAVILAAFAWMPIARIVRGVFLSLREKEYVEAARALGASNRRIIFRHMLPNAVGPIIVNATLVVAAAILAETALSYIGLGVQPPDTSLGLLVVNGQQAASTRPWLFYFPGLFIVIIVLTINFVGDGLRDAFDPTQTRVRA